MPKRKGVPCRFCGADIGEPASYRYRFCDTHCKAMGRVWGTVENWKNGVPLPKMGKRKTTRKQGERKQGKAATTIAVQQGYGTQLTFDLFTDYE